MDQSSPAPQAFLAGLGDPHDPVAAAHFLRLGLPTVRDEGWKYTSLRRLDAANLVRALPGRPVTPACALWSALPHLPRLVFVDGFARPELSTRAPDRLDRPAILARPDRDAFAALAALHPADGAAIAIPAGTDFGTLLLATVGTGGQAAFHLRHRIVLGAGARLTLVECATGADAYLHNAVFEIALGEGAVLTHQRLQDESPAAFSVQTLYADLAARSAYHFTTLQAGATLSRFEAHIRLGSAVTLGFDAAQSLAGHQHGDITTWLAHDAPAARSRQTIRNVLDGHARGVFQGRIEVARAAQKTDGYQMNHALLLSPDAEIDSKPELRINADDVKCSHGATVGELDPDQIFYLRSRGIDARTARAMLIEGFLAESFAAITDQAVLALFHRVLARTLASGPAAPDAVP